jgi:hypothetical protein
LSSKISLVLGAFGVLLALRGSVGCGTQPCFRHSDCASSEICSAGNCVPAPVDMPPPPVDASTPDATGDSPVTPNDTGTNPKPDVVDAGTPTPEADAGEASTDAPDATDSADANDAYDAPSERTSDASTE